MAIPAAAAAGRTAITVGQRLWNYAQSNLPQVAQKAEAYLKTSAGGKPVTNLIASKSSTTQQAIAKALLESGLDAKLFVEAAQLTPAEAREYAQMIASYQVQQSASVDAQQAPRASTGDAYMDRVATNEEIKEICTVLGISSDFYAKLVRGVNTHTTKDVELFQLDRRVRKERHI